MPDDTLRLYKSERARRPEPNIKVADTDGTTFPVNYVTVKRPAKSVGVKTEDQYACDDLLQAALVNFCKQNAYPLRPGGEGKLERTHRVPVVLLRNSLEETFEARRGVHVGPGYFCTACEWKLKTPEQAAKDGVPFLEQDIPLYQDDEQYHIGEARRQKWQSTGEGKAKRTVPVAGPFSVECNPLKCPYANKPHTDRSRCKLSATILLKARGWATDAFRVETTAWETVSRFPPSWDLLSHALQGFMVEAPLDLVLQFSRPKATPGEGKRPRPFWTLEFPANMNEEEVRAATLERGRKLLADQTALLELMQQFRDLSLAARSPKALLGREDDDSPALPRHVESGAALSAGERDAIGILVHQYGKPQEEAEALVRANAENLDALWAKVGAPTVPDDFTDGVYEVEEEAEAEPEAAPVPEEVSGEQEPAPAEQAEVPAAAEEDALPFDEPAQPQPEPEPARQAPAPTPQAEVPRFLPDGTTWGQAMARMTKMNEVEIAAAIWNAVASDKGYKSAPHEAREREVLRRLEQWWAREGYELHGKQ